MGFTFCPICHNKNILCFYQQDEFPVANNIICATEAAALSFPTGELEFWGCSDCGFSWNQKFNPQKLIYEATYENNQSHSQRFSTHLDEVLRCIPFPESPFILAEIGCGQGYFLHRILEQLGSRVEYAAGFDPALRLPERGDKYALLAALFSPEQKIPAFDPSVAISRHVIEHIPQPQAFLADIIAAGPSLHTLALETPNIAWIIKSNAYYDLYYEHCSLFTPYSLQLLLQQHGFPFTAVTSLFADQYLIAVGRKNHEGATLPKEDLALPDFAGFNKNLVTFTSAWRTKCSYLFNIFGPIALWGGASKAVAFTRLMKESLHTFACAVDINPSKQGNFLPGSALPIVSPAQAKKKGIKAIILTNPVYLAEVKELCQALSFEPHLELL